MSNSLSESELKRLYLDKKYSSAKIAKLFNCSIHKVNYWLLAYAIPKRSISDAIYAKHNPNGDPFKFSPPKSIEDAKLFGLGIGLYWGEGTKANQNSIRLGNTDPYLIEKFIEFLVRFFNIRREDMTFGLQLFTDIDPKKALDFWAKHLRINKHQFNKPVVTISGSIGTYRRKNEFGVLTAMYHNKKLRDLMISLIAEYKPM